MQDFDRQVMGGIISLASLAFAPLYTVLKVPLYLKFLVSRQVEWVRSKRDDK